VREGTVYEVDPDLAGEAVILWWGLFDTELYVERGERRYGPYAPVGGPIPLHHYRSFKKTKTQQRAERIATLAERLALPGSSASSNWSRTTAAPCRWCWSATPSCATTCAGPPWRKSARAPRCSGWTGSRARSAPIWTGCSGSAPPRAPPRS